MNLPINSLLRTPTLPDFTRAARTIAARPPRAKRRPPLTEIAACLVLGTACLDMWLGLYTLTRAAIYLVAVLLAFLGSALKLKFNAPAILFVVSGGLYILTALLDSSVPSLVRSDIRNILVGIALLFTLNLSGFDGENWNRFRRWAHRTVLIVAGVGAVLGIAKLIYYIFGGVIPELVDPDRGYPLGTSLRMDYNFYSLPLLMGFFSAFEVLRKDKSDWWRFSALGLLPVLALAVILSGSRRGLITVVAAAPVLAIWTYRARHNYGPRKPRFRMLYCGVLACIATLALACALNWGAVTQALGDLASTDSFTKLLIRWETLQDESYSSSRIDYWNIALERLSRFEPIEYVIGQGFGYVTDLGASPLLEDYPHNFVLSSMLYGGALQTVCLFALIAFAAAGLLRRNQGTGMLFVWYGLVLLFLSTSSNSFFSSEMAVFLTIFGLSTRRSQSAAKERNYCADARAQWYA